MSPVKEVEVAAMTITVAVAVDGIAVVAEAAGKVAVAVVAGTTKAVVVVAALAPRQEPLRDGTMRRDSASLVLMMAVRIFSATSHSSKVVLRALAKVIRLNMIVSTMNRKARRVLSMFPCPRRVEAEAGVVAMTAAEVEVMEVVEVHGTVAAVVVAVRDPRQELSRVGTTRKVSVSLDPMMAVRIYFATNHSCKEAPRVSARVTRLAMIPSMMMQRVRRGLLMCLAKEAEVAVAVMVAMTVVVAVAVVAMTVVVAVEAVVDTVATTAAAEMIAETIAVMIAEMTAVGATTVVVEAMIATAEMTIEVEGAMITEEVEKEKVVEETTRGIKISAKVATGM